MTVLKKMHMFSLSIMLSFASELLRIFPMFRIPGSATVIAKTLAPNEDENQAIPAYYRHSQINS